jgi:hypothetical protein
MTAHLRTILSARPYIIAEFVLLCLALPTFIIVNKLAPFMFSFLWSAGAYTLFILLFVYGQKLKNMWKWEEVTWTAMKPVLIRWVICTIAMAVFIIGYDPARFLYLVHERPQIIPFLLVLYPLLSALPQEIIFCSFFFKRYEAYFGSGKRMVLASALLFAYAHVLFINPVAPPISFIGGLIFAQTYRKSGSLALVTIEHGLYGNALFVIGLGWYFYHGALMSP